MRNGNSHISVVALSAHSPWRSSWIGRIILAALLIAVSALALMPDRTSAHHTPNTTYETHCRSNAETAPPGDLVPKLAASEDFVSDCIALLKATAKLTLGDDTDINWLTEMSPNLPLLDTLEMGMSRWNGVGIEDVDPPNEVYRITSVRSLRSGLERRACAGVGRADRIDIPGPLKQRPERDSSP